MQISLKAARVNANLTQRETAEKMGIDRSTVINWESGKTYPTAPQLIQLCTLYGVGVDDIFLIPVST